MEKELEEVLKGSIKTRLNYFLAYLKVQKKKLVIYMLILIATYVLFVGGY